MARGESPNIEAENVTPILCAGYALHADAVTALAKGGGRLNDPELLSWIIELQNPSVAAALLDAGTSPNDRSPLVLAAGGTPSGLPGTGSVASELDKIAASLLDHGADPNGGVRGPSPLLWAAVRGRSTLVAMLIAKGADPNHGGRVSAFLIKGALENPWLMPLSSNSSSVPVDLVPEPIADEIDNVPPLVGAAWYGQVEVSRELIEGGANVNLASDSSFTPLYAAAVRGDSAMVQLLLLHGAARRPDVRAGVRTPADAAAAAGHREIAALLEGVVQ